MWDVTLSTCAECLTRPGALLPDTRVAVAAEVLGVHFQLWKVSWARRAADLPRAARASSAAECGPGGFEIDPAKGFRCGTAALATLSAAIAAAAPASDAAVQLGGAPPTHTPTAREARPVLRSGVAQHRRMGFGDHAAVQREAAPRRTPEARAALRGGMELGHVGLGGRARKHDENEMRNCSAIRMIKRRRKCIDAVLAARRAEALRR